MAEILHKITDELPGQYVFDVVTNNLGALERVSRTAYRLVCVAEDSKSALDGRSAATILRQVRSGEKEIEGEGRVGGGGGVLIS